MRSYLGRSRLTPEGATASSRSEKSAEAGVADGKAGGEGPNEEECSDDVAMWKAERQTPAQAGRPGVGCGEAAFGPDSDEADRPRQDPEDTGPGLLQAVLARENLQRAWKRVRANKGAAGVDGLDIDQTAAHLRAA